MENNKCGTVSLSLFRAFGKTCQQSVAKIAGSVVSQSMNGHSKNVLIATSKMVAGSVKLFGHLCPCAAVNHDVVITVVCSQAGMPSTLQSRQPPAEILLQCKVATVLFVRCFKWTTM